MILSVFAWSGEVWGDTPFYVLPQQADEVEIMDGWSSATDKTYSWDGPCSAISFRYRAGAKACSGQIKVYAYTDKNCSQGETLIYTSELSSSRWGTTSWQNVTKNLDKNTYRSVKFKASQYLAKYIGQVRVTRATTLSASNQSFGNVTLNVTSSLTFSVTYSNGINPQSFTASTSSTGFSVTGIKYENTTYSSGTASVTSASGTIDVSVSFKPTEAKEYNGKVIVSLDGTSIDVNLSGKGTKEKGTPSFSWNVTNAYKNHSYSDFFTSSNTDTNYTITSNNTSLGNVVNGKLVFYDGIGTVRFTVFQSGNDDWNAHEDFFDVTVTEAQNHLPLTISSSNFGTLVRGISGDCEWNNGGIYLSNNGYNDKTAEIVFEGIPYQISFDFERHNIVATSVDFNLKLSADGNNWDEVWSSTSTSGSQTYTFTNEQLNHKYVRLTYGGNFDATFKNVTITERKYLTADKTSLAFDTNTKGSSVAAQTFTLSHCNAGYGVTVASNNVNFTVSPTTLTSTGGDLMGTQVVTVTYLNNTTGVHNGTITISDPNGTNSPITINVSGTTQTTYYTRAEAEAGVGGSAYVSYVSSEDAAANQLASTSLKISELTSEDKATNNAYWIAVPEQGYTFVEWQWPNGTQASTNVSDKWEGYEYNSEDQDDPTVVKFKAIFAPKTLTLQPTSSEYTVDYYKTVYLDWALKAGYSTIALPFNTNVETLTGRATNANDWVAQLSVVAYNPKDGYSLYFSKSNEIVANQPYILHLGTAVNSPVFTNVTVVAAQSLTNVAGKGVRLDQWAMHSNYNPNFDMNGKYGVVNDEENDECKIKLGSGTNAKLKAFRAYITTPANLPSQVKAAYLDDDNADGLLELLTGESIDSSSESVYDLQGRKLPKAQRGLNIIRGADGVVRKVMNN